MEASQDQRDRWRDFGAWLETLSTDRYPNPRDGLAKAAGVNWHTVNDLFNGGRGSPDGSWRLPNPNDSTIAKLAGALGLKASELYERMGGTYRQRNPDRIGKPVDRAVRKHEDRISTLERRVEELESFIREHLGGDAPPRQRRRRSTS